jgi:hypothetical protein
MDEESGQDRSRKKPTSKRVVMRVSNNTKNVPVGCNGIIEGKEESVNTRCRPYEAAKHVESSVQTIMFSNTKRETHPAYQSTIGI